MFKSILKVLLIVFLIVAILIGSTFLYYSWKIGEVNTYNIENFGDYDSNTEDYINKYGMTVFPKEIPEGVEVEEYYYGTSKSMIDFPGFCIYCRFKAKSENDLNRELDRLNNSGAMVLPDEQNGITIYVIPELLENPDFHFRQWYFDTEIVDGMAYFIDAAIVDSQGIIEYIYSLRWEGRSSAGNLYSDHFAHAIIEAYEKNLLN